jgi:hypothetical protein
VPFFRYLLLLLDQNRHRVVAIGIFAIGHRS